MRIAQVAPLFESVPPTGYGGTERVVSFLTEALVALGHDVTLFATADSRTEARLVPCAPHALRRELSREEALAPHLRMVREVADREAEFDVIHAHIDHLPYAVARRSRTPWITTLHGRLDLPELVPVYREFREQRVVAISESQRAQLPWLSWVGVVHHGIPRDLYRLHETAGEHLAFVGRISREKRVDRAVEIAVRAGRRLRIAAKIDDADRAYYERVKPLLEHPLVEFVGELGDAEKDEFLGGAAALLFPIDWPEPFGLIMVEALACGTPVIAWRHGSVDEVLIDGKTGFLCDRTAEAVEAVFRLDRIDRVACRQDFEERFVAERMARQYIEIFEAALREGRDGGA
ncbi:MAG TPA: glycosyltransferase family 4 protein [Myxococcota bacterium]|nr:glycosyltransferase family 4 protein [Myxococcota bacterium]